MADDLGFLQDLLAGSGLGAVPQQQAPGLEALRRRGLQQGQMGLPSGMPPSAGAGGIMDWLSGLAAPGSGDAVMRAMAPASQTALADVLRAQQAGQEFPLAGQGQAGGQPPMSDAEILASMGAPGAAPAQTRGLGISLPPVADLSGVNTQLEGLRGLAASEPAAAEAQRQALSAGVEAEKVAAQKQANIEARRQQEAARNLTTLEATLAANQESQKAREVEVDKVVKDRLAGFDKAVADANSTSIDPDRWYRDSSGGTFGKRLGSAVAMALGAVGSAFTKGPNYAMQIIQSAIDRDLMAQRAEMAKKQQAVGTAQSSVALARQQFQDVQARGFAEQASELAKAQRMLELSKAQSGTMEAQAKADAIGAALESKRLGLMADADKAERAGEWNRRTQLAGLESQRATMEAQGKQLQWKARQGAGSRPMPAGFSVADPSRPPPTADQLKEMSGKFAKLRRLQAMAGKVLEERQKSGVVSGRLGPRGDVLVKGLQMAYADLVGIKGEQIAKFMKEPDIHGLPSSTTDVGYLPERIKTLLENAEGDLASQAGGYNMALDTMTGASVGARRIK